jgi:hypothetical protein
MKAVYVLVAACLLAGCAGHDTQSDNPLTGDLVVPGVHEAALSQDAPACQPRVKHVHHPLNYADAQTGTGAFAALTVHSAETDTLRIPVSCFTDPGTKHDPVAKLASL